MLILTQSGYIPMYQPFHITPLACITLAQAAHKAIERWLPGTSVLPDWARSPVVTSQVHGVASEDVE